MEALFPPTCTGRQGKCGETRKLEYAHMEPTGLNGRGRGRRNRLLDILKHPKKYARLCKACHWIHDLLQGEDAAAASSESTR